MAKIKDHIIEVDIEEHDANSMFFAQHDADG